MACCAGRTLWRATLPRWSWASAARSAWHLQQAKREPHHPVPAARCAWQPLSDCVPSTAAHAWLCAASAACKGCALPFRPQPGRRASCRGWMLPRLVCAVQVVRRGRPAEPSGRPGPGQARHHLRRHRAGCAGGPGLLVWQGAPLPALHADTPCAVPAPPAALAAGSVKASAHLHSMLAPAHRSWHRGPGCVVHSVHWQPAAWASAAPGAAPPSQSCQHCFRTRETTQLRSLTRRRRCHSAGRAGGAWVVAPESPALPSLSGEQGPHDRA